MAQFRGWDNLYQRRGSRVGYASSPFLAFFAHAADHPHDQLPGRCDITGLSILRDRLRLFVRELRPAAAVCL